MSFNKVFLVGFLIGGSVMYCGTSLITNKNYYLVRKKNLNYMRPFADELLSVYHGNNTPGFIIVGSAPKYYFIYTGLSKDQSVELLSAVKKEIIDKE